MKNSAMTALVVVALTACWGKSELDDPGAGVVALDADERPVRSLDTPPGAVYVVETDIRLSGNASTAGIAFRTSPATGSGFKGYFAGISVEDHTAFLLKDDSEMARRKVSVEPGDWTSVRLEISGNNFVFYVDDNPATDNQFPKFDATDDTYSGGGLALRATRGSAEFRGSSVASFEPTPTGEAYQNPVQAGCADPGLLKHDGRYYAYCTHTLDFPTAANGIRLYTSDDLVNWHDEGYVLREEDSWGESRFWAPDIVERDGTFYLYYAVEERIAVAQADSPMGPFKQKVQGPMEPSSIKIDAFVFEDDDGKCYFYYVGFDNGNHIWGGELNDDMTSIRPGTIKKMISPEEPWETHMANVAEGPEVTKHKGIYYLTYSGSHFKSPHYSVGYATAVHPLGPWTKYGNNPIMKSTSYAHGTAHHSLVESPDGSEMFIVYHRHYDLTTTEPRQMAIDRIRFIPQEGGPDILEAWGPTVSPQPMPR